MKEAKRGSGRDRRDLNTNNIKDMWQEIQSAVPPEDLQHPQRMGGKLNSKTENTFYKVAFCEIVLYLL